MDADSDERAHVTGIKVVHKEVHILNTYIEGEGFECSHCLELATQL